MSGKDIAETDRRHLLARLLHRRALRPIDFRVIGLIKLVDLASDALLDVASARANQRRSSLYQEESSRGPQGSLQQRYALLAGLSVQTTRRNRLPII
jgi:hypothetical protein